jgi:NADH:quinone reductase (non-electrogenic)
MNNILIAGGGFAGVWAALVARRSAIDLNRDLSITLVNRENYLTLRPRLYEPDPQRFRVPLRPILETVDITFIEDMITTVNTSRQQATLATETGGLPYDRLILATGSQLAPPPVPGIETAFNLDSWTAAMEFDSHLSRTMPALKAPVIAIIGGGFTGIEIAMEMRGRIAAASDMATAQAARILLIDRASVVGAELGDNPRPYIEAALAEADIETRLGVSIDAVDKSGLSLSDGTRIDADIVLLASGMRANPLTEKIAAPCDELGRLMVDPDLRVAGFDNVFATGDVAHAETDDAGHTALMSCQHAMTMGRYAGYNAAHDIFGLPTTPYRQERYVTCLDLGSAGAMFTSGWDRVIDKTGMEAKKLKQNINSNIIYPPTGTREDILAAATLIPGHHKTSQRT